MTVNVAHLGLAIASPAVTTSARNYRPPTWPPPQDFPIIIDAEGNIISRYGDHYWDLSSWAKKARILNFADGPQRKGAPSNTPTNANLLRQIAAWWLYGSGAVRNPFTLVQRFYDLRSLFFLCSSRGVDASDLSRFPSIADEIAARLPPSQASKILMQLHALYEQRSQLGFVLFDHAGLTRLEAALPSHEKRQTAYIPPRIWAYQVNRLRFFLDDFHAHREKLEACFKFCLDAYSKNCGGSLAETCRIGRNKTWGPFWVRERYNGERSGRTYHGHFAQTARQFGIDELLHRWVVPTGKSFDSYVAIRSLSRYFSMVGYAGMAYLLNFSLMRIEEGWSLRADCLEVEHDQRFGPLHILRGATIKTIEDDDARWPTSPSVKVAVDAMNCVTRLRMVCAEANPDVPTIPADISNPHLVVRAYEPWAASSADDLERPLSIRPNPMTYLQVSEEYSNLFSQQELRITQADLHLARLVSPSLDGSKFILGEVWPLAWHQLRRTGAVNMQASGLVSDASLQYLLKHASRAMSLYYGQGYSRVHLNDDAQAMYVRTMYEVLGREIARLFTNRFVSPHGEKRKAEILGLIDQDDAKKLIALAKSGQVSYRETLLGGCTKRGPCPFGGVDNVAHCAGGDGGPACADVLYDREREPEVSRLSAVIRSRLADAQAGSPYKESLEAQHRAVEKVLHVVRS